MLSSVRVIEMTPALGRIEAATGGGVQRIVFCGASVCRDVAQGQAPVDKHQDLCDCSFKMA